MSSSLAEFWSSYAYVKSAALYRPEVVVAVAKKLLAATLRNVDDRLVPTDDANEIHLPPEMGSGLLRLKCRQNQRQDALKLQEIHAEDDLHAIAAWGEKNTQLHPLVRPPANLVSEPYRDPTIFVFEQPPGLIYWDSGYPWLADQFYPGETALLLNVADLVEHAESHSECYISYGTAEADLERSRSLRHMTSADIAQLAATATGSLTVAAHLLQPR